MGGKGNLGDSTIGTVGGPAKTTGSEKVQGIPVLENPSIGAPLDYALDTKVLLSGVKPASPPGMAKPGMVKPGMAKPDMTKPTKGPKKNLEVVSDNKIHQDLMISKGVDIGLGGWINMLIMLSGINSLKTIKEVIRGYTGDRNSKQIFSDEDQINLFNLIKFSGVFFKYTCGDGYLRPFELATYRLTNMLEILQNWNDYILDNKYLPQRGASFLLDDKDQIIYNYFSNDVLGYSSKMEDPLAFLSEKCK